MEQELKNGLDLKLMSRDLANGNEALKNKAQKQEKGSKEKDNLSLQIVMQDKV